jgi:hypothetical protein
VNRNVRSTIQGYFFQLIAGAMASIRSNLAYEDIEVTKGSVLANQILNKTAEDILIRQDLEST